MKKHRQKIESSVLWKALNAPNGANGPFTLETDRYVPTGKVNGVGRDSVKRCQPRFSRLGVFGAIGILLLALKEFVHIHDWQFYMRGATMNITDGKMYDGEVRQCRRCQKRRVFFPGTGLTPQDLE